MALPCCAALSQSFSPFRPHLFTTPPRMPCADGLGASVPGAISGVLQRICGGPKRPRSPSWACRPLCARAGSGAGAPASSAPAPGRVQRSAGSGQKPWPGTLGPTTSSRSSTLDGARWPRSSPRCAHPAPHPPSRARSGPACMTDRSRTRAPPSAHLAPSPRPLRTSLAHATPPRTCPARRPRCTPARWAHVLVSGDLGSCHEGSCWWRR